MLKTLCKTDTNGSLFEHSEPKTLQTIGKTCFLTIVKIIIRPVVEGPPVPVGFRTTGNHWKINTFAALSHVAIVSPLVRGLGLHSYLKTLKTIGKSKVLGYAGK